MPFNQAKALEVIAFIELLHLTGDFYGQRFELKEWQKEVISQVYGVVNENGSRQYRRGYLEIPKKNGKTTLIAALGLYHLVYDPPGGEIYCCAAEKDQAGISYRAAKSMIEQDEALEELLKVVDSKKEIYNRETGTYLKVLSAEAFSKHGINPSIIIFDELHAQPNRELWDTMTFGASSTRKQPLHWTITTSGDDPDRKSVAWEQHELALKVIKDPSLDPTLYARVYGAQDGADIYDESVWYDCNPSLGTTISIETVRSEAMAAQNNESSEKLFRWLRLNQWVQLKRISWLPITLWDETERKWNRDELRGKYCYMGLDLSSTTDLTAIALLFPPQPGLNEWRCLFEAFIPSENMKERVRRDKVEYDHWAGKYITATDGNAVDYERVQLRIEELAKLYRLKWLCADKWNSAQMTQNLAKKGIKTITIEQTMTGMSPGMKEIERLLRDGKLTHDHNPLARWCFGNVIVATDGNENIKPMKNKSFERIDLIVALIDAMAAAVNLEKKVTAYQDRGILVV